MIVWASRSQRSIRKANWVLFKGQLQTKLRRAARAEWGLHADPGTQKQRETAWPRSTTQAAIALFPLEPMPAPDKLGCLVSDGQSPGMAIVTLAGSRSRGGAYSCAGWASPLLPKPYQPNSALHYRELHSVSCTPPMPSIASTSPRTRPGPASPGCRSVGFLACWERAAPRTSSEPLRVCRRLHVWMPRVMQAVFERFRHAIGCGHVSGLKLRREPYRGPSWRYADQVQINSTSS
jgi:hypothetical protein